VLSSDFQTHGQTRKETCWICSGRGRIGCTHCSNGHVASTDLSGHTYHGSCHVCSGLGERDCPYCSGRGYQTVWDSTAAGASSPPLRSSSSQRGPQTREKSNDWIWGVLIVGIGVWVCVKKTKS